MTDTQTPPANAAPPLDPEQLAAFVRVAERAQAAQAAAEEAGEDVGAPEPEWPDGAAWVIVWGGRAFFSTEALAIHACAVEEALGDPSWSAAEPSTSPAHLVCWLAVLRAGDEGRDFAEVRTEVLAMPLAALTDTLRIRVD